MNEITITIRRISTAPYVPTNRFAKLINPDYLDDNPAELPAFETVIATSIGTYTGRGDTPEAAEVVAEDQVLHALKMVYHDAYSRYLVSIGSGSLA